MPTVLVVDDEPDILEVLRLTLESAGYRVLTAADGAQALDAVSREVPDAMLLDVGMPHVDGWEVLERIKSSNEAELATVPVIMVTAWTSEEDRVRGGIEGAVRYLAKPFNPADVVGQLNELLRPGAPAEPDERSRVRRESLERLARLERGADDDEEVDDVPRVRLTRLDRPHPPEPPPPGELDRERLDRLRGSLSPRQTAIVDALTSGVTVAEIADAMGVSRSNVYAILRRVAKRAGIDDGRTLIRRLRRLGATANG